MKNSFEHMEQGRMKDEKPISKPGDKFGAFTISHKDGRVLLMSVDNGAVSGWEHVSVTCIRKHRKKFTAVMPDWELMCMVKGVWWDSNEAVIQLHPPQDDYVNIHPECLHLWKSLRQEYLLPPKETV